MDLPAIGPSHAQPSVLDAALKLDEIRPVHVCAVRQADRFCHAHETGGCWQRLVNLAVVSEAHLSLRQGARLPLRLGVGREVSQREITDASFREAAQLLCERC
jgi:hypothetical protein